MNATECASLISKTDRSVLAEIVQAAIALKEEKKIPAGWALCSADFSMQAADGSGDGSVTLVRAKEQRKLWHSLPEQIQELHPLHVFGRGDAFDNALVAANKRAAALGPLPGEGGST
jgi:hypothetical protein